MDPRREQVTESTLAPCQSSGGFKVVTRLGRRATNPLLPVPTHKVPSRSSHNERTQLFGNPWARSKWTTPRFGKIK